MLQTEKLIMKRIFKISWAGVILPSCFTLEQRNYAIFIYKGLIRIERCFEDTKGLIRSCEPKDIQRTIQWLEERRQTMI
jgi:hypothetical protein